MVRSLLSLVTLAAVLPAFVSAHGQLRGVTVNGQWYDAPNLYYDGDARNQNTPIRKGYKADFPSYLLPTNFADNNKMACQEAGAAPGIAKVSPGQKVTWKWEGATKELSDQGFPDGTWVHAMGFTSTWIADCNGDCKNVDASQVGWSKIDFNGLNPGNIVDNLRNAMANKPEPYRSQGLWAMAQMIENDSQYDSFIPNNLKNGQYLLRSEISAVHNPFNGDPSSGPQNYVGCLQIQVENGGDVTLPGGTKAGSFYDPNGDYAHYSVFNSPASFAEPGPAKWDGASASGNTNNGGNTGGNTGNTGNNNSGNTGGDNSNNNNNNSGNTGGDNNNSGNTGGDSNNNSGGNNNTGNGSPSSGNNGKQCRRRSNSKRSKVARSLHAAHAKRHH